MKHNALPFLLLLFVVAIPSYAQPIITSFERPAELVDVSSVGRITAISPSEGPNQVWDYGDVTKIGEGTTVYTSAINNPNYPSALSSFPDLAAFNAFIIQSTRYLKLDENGFFEMGRSMEPISYSISTISGGENDSLHFTAIHDVYDNCGRVLIKFPATYLDQWSNTYKRTTPFELSVAAFGLDRTPGFERTTVTHSREVTGYGTLVIPKTDGTPSVPIEALLVKVNETRVDSYFLNGFPAPDILLTSFGLTQGQTTELVPEYIWYNPNFGTAILGIAPDVFFFYRPQVVDTIIATTIKETDLVASTYFPNPVATGQTLTISTETQLTTGTIQLTDIRGRMVHRAHFTIPNHPEVQLTIPATLNEGMYLYQIQDEQALPISSGKVFVNR